MNGQETIRKDAIDGRKKDTDVGRDASRWNLNDENLG
jgi:hypothetical protein